MNAYEELRNKQQEGFNALPIKFAFGQQQFDRMMQEFGLEPDETDKIYRMSDTGGFYLRTDAPKIRQFLLDNEKVMKDAVAADTTGEGFIKDMFLYELNNHEYGYTLELEDTLDALGYTLEEIEKSPALKNGLRLARNQIHKANGIEWEV